MSSISNKSYLTEFENTAISVRSARYLYVRERMVASDYVPHSVNMERQRIQRYQILIEHLDDGPIKQFYEKLLLNCDESNI